MKAILIALLMLACALAHGQEIRSGRISGPDILGNRTIRYNNGLSARLSGPDLLGAQTLRYSNGLTVRYSGPDILGNRSITVISKPHNK